MFQIYFTNFWPYCLIFLILLLNLVWFLVTSSVCLRTATRPLIGHLYEVISLDSDWFILQEFQKIYTANHDQVNSENLLDFNRGDLIFSKKFRFWNCHPPNIGHKNNKANVKKHFIRGSLDRVFHTSKKYPSILQ